MNALSSAAQRYLPSVLIFVGLLVVWQLVVTFLGVREYILPSPASVWQAMVHSDLPWGHHTMTTLVEVLGGPTRRSC